MVAVHGGAWITFALLTWNDRRFHFWGLSVLDWTCLLIILGCVQTIAVRLKKIFFTLASGRRRG
jgi:hypothetical protein